MLWVANVAPGPVNPKPTRLWCSYHHGFLSPPVQFAPLVLLVLPVIWLSSTLTCFWPTAPLQIPTVEPTLARPCPVLGTMDTRKSSRPSLTRH